MGTVETEIAEVDEVQMTLLFLQRFAVTRLDIFQLTSQWMLSELKRQESVGKSVRLAEWWQGLPHIFSTQYTVYF